MGDRRVLDASQLTADCMDGERRAFPDANESNRIIAGGLFRQPLLHEQEEEDEDHEREVKSTCVNINPALHQSSIRVVGPDAAASTTTQQQQTRNHVTSINTSRASRQRFREEVKETPVARMLRYLESLPPDRPIRRELTEFSFWKSVRTEFIATVIFVIISLGASLKKSNSPFDPLTELSSGVASGLITSILMYLTSNQIANYKSCHLNPCLTLALMISRHHDSHRRRRVSPVRFLLFAAAQVLASLTASCILQGLVFHHESSPADPGRNNSSFSLASALPQPTSGVHESNVFGFEFLAAFLVTITYFAVTDERKGRKESRRKRFAELTIESSAGRGRMRAGRSSHGNEEGSGREGMSGKLQSHDDEDGDRRQRRGGGKHRLSNNCHPSGGQCDQRQQERLSAACTHQGMTAEAGGMADGDGRPTNESHALSLPATRANVMASAVKANSSPSSSSSHSTSCCTSSTSNSSSCASFSSNSPSRRTIEHNDGQDYEAKAKFEYVGFAVIAAHLFTVSTGNWPAEALMHLGF